MATFPSAEPQTVILAQDFATGLATSAAIYPSPPVAAADLQTEFEAHVTVRDAAVTAQAAAKNEALEALTHDIQTDLSYAENTVDYDDNKLKLLG